MAVHVARFDYSKRDAKIREYQVDDDFLELLHMLKDNGSNQYSTLVYRITDAIVNSFSDDAGMGWTHDNGTMFGIGRSKQAAVNHLLNWADEEGQMDDEELGWVRDALAKAGGQVDTGNKEPEKEAMSNEDKNKLRGHAGIERQ
ncbi:MAG: hypothetical protein JXR12_05595 [Neptunomonas phycophila]|uniref:hypothetical protein n=1 Tax=Neptunomonas phycophila TaxID=1572645 RepID=UPI003B8DA484